MKARQIRHLKEINFCKNTEKMGALTTALIAIAGIGLGWITIEMACKPCLEKGREAIDRNLNPDYDPDDDEDINSSSIRAPLNPQPNPSDSTSDDVQKLLKD